MYECVCVWSVYRNIFACYVSSTVNIYGVRVVFDDNVCEIHSVNTFFKNNNLVKDNNKDHRNE